MKLRTLMMFIVAMCLSFNCYADEKKSSKPKKKQAAKVAESKGATGFRDIKFGTEYAEVEARLNKEFALILQSNKEQHQIKLGDLKKAGSTLNMKLAYSLGDTPVEVFLNFDKDNKFESFEINGYFVPREDFFFSSYEKIYQIMIVKNGKPIYTSPHEMYSYHTQVGIANILKKIRSYITVVDYWDDGSNNVFMGLTSNMDTNRYNTYVKIVPYKVQDPLKDVMKAQIEKDAAEDLQQRQKDFKKYKNIIDGTKSF